MVSLSLLWGIFPTQVSNQDLLHCTWILYHLSHQGSPKECLVWSMENSRQLINVPTNISIAQRPPGEKPGSHVVLEEKVYCTGKPD